MIYQLILQISYILCSKFVLDLVVQLLKTEDFEEKENIKSKLEENTNTVKDLVINFKKT